MSTAQDQGAGRARPGAHGLEQLGAHAWLARTTAELGGTAAAPADPELDERLTEHERLVARAVADGLTNKQIAARLFLTPKTVEWHLSRIYRKLEVESRTQLALRLRAER